MPATIPIRTSLVSSSEARAEAESYGAALSAMVDRAWLKTAKYQGQQFRAYRVGAHPDLVEFEKRFVRRMARLGVPMFAHEMVRNSARQEALYSQGLTRARAGQSAHQWGCAVDLVHGTKAWNLDAKSWAIIGHVGREVAGQAGIAIRWGGDWSFYDPAHWELENWKELKAEYPFGLK